MKAKLFLLIFCGIASTLFSQDIELEYDITPDSIYTYDVDGSAMCRYAFTFNDHRQMLSSTTWEWDGEANTYTFTDRVTFTYTSNYDIESELIESWRTESGSWRIQKKNSYSYDNANNLTQIVIQTGDELALSDRELFEYDSQNRKIKHLTEDYNWQSASWEPDERRLYHYDGAGNLSEETWENWSDSNSAYEFIRKIRYKYDNQNNMIEEERLSWKTDGWENSRLKKLTYDKYNNFDIVDNYRWQSDAGEYALHDQEDYDYLDDSRPLSYLQKNWVEGSWDERYEYSMIYGRDTDKYEIQMTYRAKRDGQWVLEMQYDIEYDDNGDPVVIQFSNQDGADIFGGRIYNTYLIGHKFVAYYNKNGIGVPATGIALNKNSLNLAINNTELLIATILPENASNKVVLWSIDNEQVATVSGRGLVTGKSKGRAVVTATTKDGMHSATCSVEVGGAGFDDDSMKILQVYPNPTSGELKIENGELKMENMELFDIFGRKVLETKETASDISHLPAGVYLLKVGGKTAKVVKY